MDPLTKTGWILYQALANLAGPPILAAASLKGRFGGRWRERLGFSFPQGPAGGRVFWFHAASVGEASSAAVVIKALLGIEPKARIILSVGTPAGLETAGNIFKDEAAVSVIAAPLDFWGSAARATAAIKPGVLVIWETELWPNLIAEAKKNGARLALAAGRMTERSYKRYRRVRSFMAGLLERFDLIAPIGLYEYDFFSCLGAPPERLRILGNPKFDHLIAEAESAAFQQKKEGWRKRLWGDGKPGPLLVAGSTHQGEEELILNSFLSLKKEKPGLKLLLAPRHLGRVPELLKLAGPRAVAASADGPLLARAEVTILDSLGQLSALYALSTVALVGGSFRPGLMGHNPLEPAAVARPIIFGPWMASFQLEAKGLIKADGAVESSPEELESKLRAWLDEPPAAQKHGLAAKAFLAARPPAAPALAQAILDLSEKK